MVIFIYIFIQYLDMGTALHVAVIRKCEQLIDILFANNIDVNLTDGNQCTALHKAFMTQSTIKIVYKLLRYGANCKLWTRSRSTLHYAIDYKNVKIVNLIISKLDDMENVINEVDSTGRSLLNQAIHTNEKDITHLIVNQKNINLNLENVENRTPLQEAIHIFVCNRNLLSLNMHDYTLIDIVLNRRRNTTIRNITKAFLLFLRTFKNPSEMHLAILDLLLFHGRPQIDRFTFENTRYRFRDEAIQMILISLANRMCWNDAKNELCFYDSEQQQQQQQSSSEQQWSIETLNSDLNLVYFNEIVNMRTSQMLTQHKFTYLQFLCMDKYEIANLLRRIPEYHSVLNSPNKIQLKYPKYQWLITQHYTIGKQLYVDKEMLKKCLIKNLPIYPNKLNSYANDSMDFLFEYLTDFDIFNFIEAYRIAAGRPTLNIAYF